MGGLYCMCSQVKLTFPHICPSAFGIYMFSLCSGIFLYFLIIWLFWMGTHWLHWKVKSSLWSLAVSNGGGGIIISFPYIFLLVDCFKWALIDCIQKWRVYSELWQFQMGGIIVSFTQVNLTIWAHFALASQTDLPGRAENLRNVNCSCHGSVVLGGYIIRFIWCHTDILLYLPISWVFRMVSHWLYWKG